MCVELLCLYPGSILDTKVAQTMVQINNIPDEMEFHPKFVLNDIQIGGVIRGLSAQQNGLI
jgi:hypothetical protein